MALCSSGRERSGIIIRTADSAAARFGGFGGLSVFFFNFTPDRKHKLQIHGRASTCAYVRVYTHDVKNMREIHTEFITKKTYNKYYVLSIKS